MKLARRDSIVRVGATSVAQAGTIEIVPTGSQ